MKAYKLRMGTIVISSITLLAGGLIYILWRSESLLMFDWFAASGLGEEVSNLRFFAAPYSASFPEWVYFALPNGLWLFSGLLFFYSIWTQESFRGWALWSSLLCSLAFLSEVGQYWSLVPGTFDRADLVCLLTGSICAFSYVMGCEVLLGITSNVQSNHKSHM